MKTVAQIKQDIRQVRQEIADCERSLPTIVGRDGLEALYAAQESLRTRQSSLQALLDYLPVAEEQERAQAVLDTRAEHERTRDDATEEHNRLDADFEAVMLPLEQYILDALDDLDRIAMQRGRAESRRSEAAYELRGNVDDYDRSALSTSNGWFSKATEHARSDVRVCLRELYAARHGMGGRLQLTGQDSGYRPLMVSRPQELLQPDPNDALIAQLSAEFAQKRAQNGS